MGILHAGILFLLNLNAIPYTRNLDNNEDEGQTDSVAFPKVEKGYTV